jgi:hypothetical protein
MAKATVEDLRTMYQGTVCMYKNKPYYIEEVGGRYQATCFDLSTQRSKLIEINEVDFTAPQRRLGFINVKRSVVFASRIPVRRYKVGLSKENTTFECLPVGYPEGEDMTRRHLNSLKTVEMGDTIFNRYPSIEESHALLEAGHRCVAFDRQFAMSDDGKLYYKTKVVGGFGKKPTTPYDFKFKREFTHLILLLDNNHEKSISDART